jgi:hypothetical protein
MSAMIDVNMLAMINIRIDPALQMPGCPSALGKSTDDLWCRCDTFVNLQSLVTWYWRSGCVVSKRGGPMCRNVFLKHSPFLKH